MAKSFDLVVGNDMAISSNTSSSGVGCCGGSNISSTEGARVEELEMTADEEDDDDEQNFKEDDLKKNRQDNLKDESKIVMSLVKKKLAYVETSLDDLSYSSSSNSSSLDDLTKIRASGQSDDEEEERLLLQLRDQQKQQQQEAILAQQQRQALETQRQLNQQDRDEDNDEEDEQERLELAPEVPVRRSSQTGKALHIAANATSVAHPAQHHHHQAQLQEQRNKQYGQVVRSSAGASFHRPSSQQSFPRPVFAAPPDVPTEHHRHQQQQQQQRIISYQKIPAAQQVLGSRPLQSPPPPPLPRKESLINRIRQQQQQQELAESEKLSKSSSSKARQPPKNIWSPSSSSLASSTATTTTSCDPIAIAVAAHNAAALSAAAGAGIDDDDLDDSSLINLANNLEPPISHQPNRDDSPMETATTNTLSPQTTIVTSATIHERHLSMAAANNSGETLGEAANSSPLDQQQQQHHKDQQSNEKSTKSANKARSMDYGDEAITGKQHEQLPGESLIENNNRVKLHHEQQPKAAGEEIKTKAQGERGEELFANSNLVSSFEPAPPSNSNSKELAAQRRPIADSNGKPILSTFRQSIGFSNLAKKRSLPVANSNQESLALAVASAQAQAQRQATTKTKHQQSRSYSIATSTLASGYPKQRQSIGALTDRINKQQAHEDNQDDTFESYQHLLMAKTKYWTLPSGFNNNNDNAHEEEAEDGGDKTNKTNRVLRSSYYKRSSSQETSTTTTTTAAQIVEQQDKSNYNSASQLIKLEQEQQQQQQQEQKGPSAVQGSEQEPTTTITDRPSLAGFEPIRSGSTRTADRPDNTTTSSAGKTKQKNVTHSANNSDEQIYQLQDVEGYYKQQHYNNNIKQAGSNSRDLYNDNITTSITMDGGPEGQPPAGASNKSKEEWFKQMYKKMHGSASGATRPMGTPTSSAENNLFKSINSQPDTTEIKIKLKSPKHLTDHRYSPSYYSEEDFYGQRRSSPGFKPGNISDYLPGQSSISQHERNLKLYYKLIDHIDRVFSSVLPVEVTSRSYNTLQARHSHSYSYSDKATSSHPQAEQESKQQQTAYYMSKSGPQTPVSTLNRRRATESSYYREPLKGDGDEQQQQYGNSHYNKHNDSEHEKRCVFNRLLKSHQDQSDQELLLMNNQLVMEMNHDLDDDVDHDDPRRQYVAVQHGHDIPLKGLRKPAPQANVYKDHMFSDESINIHYKSPTSRLLKMNTFNEFELNKIKKLYADELASKLQRSKSSRRLQQQQQQHPGTSTSVKATSFNSRRRETQSAERLTTFMPQQQALFSNTTIKQPASSRSFNLNNPSESPFIDLNRYQRAFLKKATSSQSFRRSSGRGSSYSKGRPICFGKALFDFQATSERELSLKRGDLVEMLEIFDHSWALVEDCQSGLRGLVPLNYIDYSVGCAVAKRDVSGAERVITTTTRTTPLLTQQNITKEQTVHDLLPMSKGEPITLIRRLKGHWYEASNTRQAMGLVWSNDLDIIKQPVLQESTSPLLTSAPGRQQHYNNYANNATANCLQRQQQQQKQRHQQKGDEFSDEDDYDNAAATTNEARLLIKGCPYTAYRRKVDEDHHYGHSAGHLDDHDHDDDEDDEEEMLILESGERVLAKRRRRARSASAGRSCCNNNHVLQQQQQHACLAMQQPLEPAMTTTGQYCCQQQTMIASNHEHSCAHHLHQQAGHHQMLLPRRSSSSPYIANLGNHNHNHNHNHGHNNIRNELLVMNNSTVPPAQQVNIVNNNNHANSSTSLPRLCRVKFAYKPRQKDELELIVDDVLVVVHECDDGWFIGSSYSTKETGTFPGNFVESI